MISVWVHLFWTQKLYFYWYLLLASTNDSLKRAISPLGKAHYYDHFHFELYKIVKTVLIIPNDTLDTTLISKMLYIEKNYTSLAHSMITLKFLIMQIGHS